MYATSCWNRRWPSPNGLYWIANEKSTVTSVLVERSTDWIFRATRIFHWVYVCFCVFCWEICSWLSKDSEHSRLIKGSYEESLLQLQTSMALVHLDNFICFRTLFKSSSDTNEMAAFNRNRLESFSSPHCWNCELKTTARVWIQQEFSMGVGITDLPQSSKDDFCSGLHSKGYAPAETSNPWNFPQIWGRETTPPPH